MGAAASIVTVESLPESLRPLHEVCERLKLKIAEADAALIDTESKKMFKGHTNIIDELTARSRAQIRRLFESFPDAVKNLDALVEGGNHYAQFIKMLAKSKVELEMDAIRACTGDTIDEELLVDIVGTSTIAEIKEFDELFHKEKGFSVFEYFASRCKDDSPLKKFIARLMQFDRDESNDVDDELADKQVDVLHKAGASRLIGVDEEPIIEILSCASRAQCALINEVYQKKYHMKLERAINIKFKGSVGKLMVLWTQPVNSAVLQCISYLSQKMLVDKIAIGRMVAKYEKDFWQQSEPVCVKLFQKSLSEFLGKAVSGTFHRALKGWMALPSPDKGFERILSLYLDNKLSQEGVTLAQLLEDSAIVEKFQFLLEKQAQELKLFMVAHKMKLDPQDQAILKRAGSSVSGHLFRSSPSGSKLIATSTPAPSRTFSPRETADNDEEDREGGRINSARAKSGDSHDQDDEPSIERKRSSSSPAPPLGFTLATAPVPMPAKLTKALSLRATDNAGLSHDELATKVYNYLVAEMEKHDKNGEGSFPEEEFWAHIKELPLEDFGMTESDIDAIRNWSEWEMDGQIFYYETLFEFSDSVLSSIANKEEGETDVLAVLKAARQLGLSPHRSSNKLLAAPADDPFVSPGAKSRKTVVAVPEFHHVVSEKRLTIVNQFPRVPLYLRQYVVDTVAAFDLDCNGYITADEVEALLATINISALTMDKIMGNKDKVEPKEVSDAVCKEIHQWFGDGQEHFICLVDKSSGAYFWFNTLDESTQWADNASYASAASTEDEAGAADTEAEGKDAEETAEEEQKRRRSTLKKSVTEADIHSLITADEAAQLTKSTEFSKSASNIKVSSEEKASEE